MILLVASLFILACYKWGDWRNWKSYYPTILFMIVGDLIYLYVASAKPLWLYPARIFPGLITTLIIAIIIYPCTVLLFIPAFQQSGLKGKISSITIWVVIYFDLELVAFKYNYIQHFNGWNLGYSFLFDCLVFPLLAIHQRSALIGWLLAILIGGGITLWFTLPAPY